MYSGGCMVPFVTLRLKQLIVEEKNKIRDLILGHPSHKAPNPQPSAVKMLFM